MEALQCHLCHKAVGPHLSSPLRMLPPGESNSLVRPAAGVVSATFGSTSYLALSRFTPVQASAAAACRSMPQHAVACRSMPQHLFLGAAHGGFEACRSMPQRAKIFTWRTFFFITCRTSEPFVAQMSQNWMVAQWSMYQVPVWRVLGSIPEKGNSLPVSSSLLLHRSSLFWCIGKVLGTTSACLPCLSAPIEV